MAPSMVKLLIASTTIMTSNAIIIYLVTRSSPFWRLKEQIKKPSTTTKAMKPTMPTGSAQICS